MTQRVVNPRRKSARRIGTAAGLVGVTVAAAPSTPIAEASEPQPKCIDVIGDPAYDDSGTWDLDEWRSYFDTCDAYFGFGKVIIDVVTEGGEPLPAEVDLDLITRSLEFGYADTARDAQRLRFDPYCELEWDDGNGEAIYLGSTADDTDFRRDESLAGPEKLLLEILGDQDLEPAGPGAEEFEIMSNQVLLTQFCDVADTDQLRQNAIADVGGGYQLLAGVNATYAGGDLGFGSSTPATIQVVVTPVPPPTTTTTTTTTTSTTTTTVPGSTTTTTAAATTTTAAPMTTTTSAPTVAAPSTTVVPAIGPSLPETGSRNAAMALFAVGLLALGGLTSVISRRRPARG